MTDIKLGLRRTRTSPGYSLLFLVVLSSAIGAMAAVQAVMTSVFHADLGIPEPSRVINVYGKQLGGDHSTAAWQLQLLEEDYQALAKQQSTFDGLLAWVRIRPSFDSSPSERVFGEAVSLNYFQVLGVRAALGSLFGDGETNSGSIPPLVISYDTWKNRFQGNPGVLGQVVHLTSGAFTIAGVAQAGFHGVDMPALASTSVWVPLNVAGSSLTAVQSRVDRVFVKGRLKTSATLTQAAAEVSLLESRLDSSDPQRISGDGRVERRTFTLLPATDLLLHESVHAYSLQAVRVAQGALAILILVACSNLAGLQTSRLATRSRDVAIRVALGASSWSVLSALAADIAVLVPISLIFSLFIAAGLCSLATTTLSFGDGLVLRVAPVLGRAALGALLISGIAALVLAGLVPAWHAFRAGKTLRRIGDGQAITRWKGRRILIGAQVSIALLMMALATLFVQKSAGVLTRDFGVDYSPITTAVLSANQSLATTKINLSEILHAVQQSPDVEAAALVSGLPIGYPLRVASVTVDGRESIRQHPMLLSGAGDVAGALGLRVLAGSAAPSSTDVGVAIITKTLASALFGHEPSLGQIIEFQASPKSPRQRLGITGVVADITGGLDTGSGDGVLIVVTPSPTDVDYVLAARGRKQPRSTSWLVDTIASVAPNLQIQESRSGIDLLRSVTAFPMFAAVLTLALAVLSTLLSVAGLVGVVSSVVASRTREIGLRLALGASRTGIVFRIVADGMLPVLGGVFLGEILMIVGSAILGAVAPSIEGPPLWSYFVMSILVISAGLISCAGPARRVATIDPATTLREL